MACSLPALPAATLGSLYIEQDGCCVATVTVDHDSVSGSVTVEEGVANGDTISLTNSTAGATVAHPGLWPDHGRLQWLR